MITISASFLGKGIVTPLLQNYENCQEFRVNWTDTEGPKEQIVQGQNSVNNLIHERHEQNPKVTKLEKNAIPKTGAGRLLRLEDSNLTLAEAVDKVKQHLGMKHLRIAMATNASLGMIRNI